MCTELLTKMVLVIDFPLFNSKNYLELFPSVFANPQFLSKTMKKDIFVFK